MEEKTMSYPRDPAILEKKINYFFNSKDLLYMALRHSSYVNESRTNIQSNERLEFLGDSILSAITSKYIYDKFPDKNEGELSSIRRQIVERDSLAQFARQIELGEYLFLGKGEEKNGGRNIESNLEDAFESLVAAIYLDGGIDKARQFVLPFVISSTNIIKREHNLQDPKSILQEKVQETPGEKLQYVIVSESGPDHNKTFICEARINSNVFGRGIGKSKKEAEKEAAKNALELIGIKFDDIH